MDSGCLIFFVFIDLIRCIWVLVKADLSPFWHTFTIILLVIEAIIILFFLVCLIFGTRDNNKQ